MLPVYIILHYQSYSFVSVVKVSIQLCICMNTDYSTSMHNELHKFISVLFSQHLALNRYKESAKCVYRIASKKCVGLNDRVKDSP